MNMSLSIFSDETKDSGSDSSKLRKHGTRKDSVSLSNCHRRGRHQSLRFSRYMVSTAHQQVVEKEAETDRRRAVIEAEKLAQVAKIQYGQKILSKESEKRIAEIEAEMHLARERAMADANKYKSETETESNKLKLSPAFLQWSMYQALAQNTKIYFGNSIPNIFAHTDDLLGAHKKSNEPSKVRSDDSA